MKKPYDDSENILEFKDNMISKNPSKPYINLGHELIHAWHSVMGVYNFSRKKVDYKGANG